MMQLLTTKRVNQRRRKKDNSYQGLTKMAVLTDRTQSFFKYPPTTRSSKVNYYLNWQSSPRSIPQYDLFTPRPYNIRILLELWTRYLTKESSIYPFEISSDIAAKEFIEPVIAKHLVNVIYDNRNAVETLLGSQGKHVLEEVINPVQDTAQEEKWPLEKIEIRYTRDFEVKEWEYIVVVFVFNCMFSTANKYLEHIYQNMDSLIDRLGAQEQELITNLIYLDIETNEDVPSS